MAHQLCLELRYSRMKLQYDNRMRVSQWNIPGVMGWNYSYQYFGENTGRVTYAQNITDPTLDRSYHYDHVGRLQSAYTGSSARAHVGIGTNWLSDGPYAQENNVYDVWGNTLSRTGWGGMNPQYGASYINNKMNGMTYDNSGNLTDAGGGWMFSYDATGQQATSAMGNVQMFYDGDRLRGKKSENGIVTYYLRSSVLGGQVVADLNSTGGWMRGYVYLGGEILAVQQNIGVHWMHQDPVAKSKRITDASGNLESTIELNPWGGETNRSSNEAFQPRRFTTYEQDSIGSYDAMHRRYNRWWARFEQPDPYGGSYDLTNPQSFNRYSYVQNDPVNFVDPTGLLPCEPGNYSAECGYGGFGGWGGGFDMNDRRSLINLSGPQNIRENEYDHDERYHPENGPFRFQSAFLWLAWFGWFPQKTRQYDQSRVNEVADACVEKVNLLKRNDRDLYETILNSKRDVQSQQLTLAHAATESSFFANAVGYQNELGLFQIKLSTANSLGIGTFTRAQVLDPARNTRLGTTHLQNLINSFGGDVRTALGAYKQGESGVRKQGLTVQSQEYADAILQCERRLQGR